MKKIILWIIGSVVALAIIAVVALTLSLDSMVKAGVNRFGPTITKTKVELAGAHLSPLTGTGTLSGFLVGNPPGWTSDRAFYLGKVRVEMVPASLFKDHVVINEILIDRPEFVYETKLVSSNIKELLRNIQDSVGQGTAKRPTTKTGQPVKFEVKHFRLQNAQLTLGVGPTAVTVPMPPLSLSDVGSKEGGITADQLAGIIMGHVLDRVLTTAAGTVVNVGKSMGATGVESAGKMLGKAGEGLKKILEKK